MNGLTLRRMQGNTNAFPTLHKQSWTIDLGKFESSTSLIGK